MTYKNKNILLVIGFLLVLIIAYQVAFSKTITIRSELHLLREQSISFQNLTSLSANLSHREKFIDSILKKNNIRNSSIQNNLLEFLNQESSNNNFVISSFNEPHKVVENNATITSYQFTLRGGFNDLQNVIYKLEQEYSFGKISHFHFEKKRDYRKRKDYLECFVIVEGLVSE